MESCIYFEVVFRDRLNNVNKSKTAANKETEPVPKAKEVHHAIKCFQPFTYESAHIRKNMKK